MSGGLEHYDRQARRNKTISDEIPCRGCGAPIRFIKMRTGGKMPVEATPGKGVCVTKNDHVPYDEPRGDLLDVYEPHWGNCEKAEDFKT